MRLHELAKEIGVSSKNLLALSREIGLNIKSHSSNLAAGEESILRIAMKQEMEELAAEEAKVAAEKAAIEAAENPEPVVVEPEETAAEEVSEQTDPVEVEAEGTPPLADDAIPSDATPAPVSEEGEGTLKPAASAGTEDQATDTPPSESVKDEPKEPAVEEKPAVTVKKMPPRKPGATILGRIKLAPPTPSTRKTGRGRDTRTPVRSDSTVGARTGQPDPLIADGRINAATGKAHFDPEQEEKAKGKRFIKPKLQTPVFDPEDDPLLQGIRIRHWDKQKRPRRSGWRPGAKGRRKLKPTIPVVHKKLEVVPPIVLKDLSQQLGIKVQDLLVCLMNKGIMAHINSSLEEEAILQIAVDFNREIDIVEEKDLEKALLEKDSADIGGQDEMPRSPIVTFLGHVDHGKTSLLDAIRKSNVVDGEDGGITQHISAYKVDTGSGHSVVFLDTPGHKAFTEMRARGANVTDIVVLVVAADDGVMPQTEEAIQHAMAAEVPIVVAINKIDKHNANTMRVKQQLAGLGVMTEDWGGEVGCVEVSATTGEGLPELLERLVLEAEIQELSCNPQQNAMGVVLEARKDEEAGIVVTLLVHEGTLCIRDHILAGENLGRIRAMVNDKGESIDEAGPATPVNIYGFDTIPEAGESFIQIEDAASAREIASIRREKQLAGKVAGEDKYAITLENLFESIEAGKIKEIRVVLKVDVKGSLEVLSSSLGELVHDEVKIKLIREGLGSITEDDVLLAMASQAVIIGFHVLPDEKARKVAEEKAVDIRTYRVIYQLIDDLRAAMEGALEPIKKEKVTAHLEIRAVFKSSRTGNIAGCMVSDGTIHRNNRVRVLRNKEAVFDGELASLKRFKDDHREVKEGFECGVKVAGYDDIQEGDIIEAYEWIEEKRTLDIE